MIALLLAMQEPAMTPLPRAAEPAMERYGACLFGRTAGGDRSTRNAPANVAAMKKALSACVTERVASIEQADQALMKAPGYEDAQVRHAFLVDRFESMDALLLEVAAGGMDPDKWDER